MRWEGRRGSRNVQDRRGAGPKMAVGGGMGLGVIAIVLVIILLGGNPQSLLQNLPAAPGQGAPAGAPAGGAQTTSNPEDDARVQFVSVVLADTEDVWNEIFAQRGARYVEPQLVVFEGQVRSACGFASSATGPFYCPGDSQVYIDLSFYDELATRFGAPGDFAQAYVIAHEVGHHIQHLLGKTDEVHRLKGRVPESEYNDASVRLELQADYYAGVWAHHAQRMHDILEPGDLEEAFRAAAAVGDDTIQKRTRGYVVPDSFTHGTAEQRMRWFRLGLESGDMTAHDPFKVAQP